MNASDLLTHLLGQAEDCLTEAGRSLPENRYVSHNAPSWDCCDLLTVHVSNIGTTRRFPVDEQPLKCATRWTMEVTVTLLRCVPVFDGAAFPTPDALNESALGLSADAWSLFHCFGCRALDGSLLDGCPCTLVSLGSARPIGPQGGCGGYTFTVTVEPTGVE